jgi:hypothetical protein
MISRRGALMLGLNIPLIGCGAASKPTIQQVNFATLFPGAFQVVQTDLGLTYGGTLLATGNTPPVITLTGSLSTTAVPIQVKCTLLGALGTWTGTYSFDNGTTTTTFTSNSTINLTGKGNGLILNIAAGNAATDNNWNATCAGLADQSGNAKHYSQVLVNKQPTISVGVNGKPYLSFDGISNILVSTLNLASPTTQTMSMYIICQPIDLAAGGGGCAMFGDNAQDFSFIAGTGIWSTTARMFNGANGPNSPVPNSLIRIVATFTGTTSDTLKVGSASIATGLTAGTHSGTSLSLGGNGTSPETAKMKLLMAAWVPSTITGTLLSTADAAANSALGYGIGSVQV